jgi:DNA processing protein
LSEYPPGARPLAYHFPVRNRIISGLSQGTVVVEAGAGSGALITARMAILQGRDVFAVPANVGSAGAEGTNGLLQDGANLALRAADILAPYEYIYANQLHTERLPGAEQASKADLRYLASLGVIELAERPKSTQAAQTAELPKEEPKKVEKPKRARATARRRKETVAEGTETEAPKSAGTKNPDEILASLTETQKAVLLAMPDDHAVTADALSTIGYHYGEIIAALTMLEILGLVQKLPGALYTKV